MLAMISGCPSSSGSQPRRQRSSIQYVDWDRFAGRAGRRGLIEAAGQGVEAAGQGVEAAGQGVEAAEQGVGAAEQGVAA